MQKKPVPIIRRMLSRESLLFLIPCIVFIAHAQLFRRWIIDDAGISFAYARNLASGYGLVAQHGSQPVEGYSNFLWTVLLAPFFRLGLFHPTITPKVLSIVLVLATFYALHKTLTQVMRESMLASMVALMLLAMNSSFVIWCTSGLENPLYVLLVSLLLYLSVRAAVSGKVTGRSAILAGLMAGGAAMTRPDGIIYSVLFPLILLAARRCHRKDGGPYLPGFLTYAASFIIVFGGFMVFRLAYFHDLTPNTFYAKGGPSLRDAGALLTLQPRMVIKALDLVSSVTSKLGGIVLFALTALTVYRASIRRFKVEHTVLLLFLLWSASAYLLLPKDWMGEYRFATPFFAFFYLYAVVIVKSVLADLNMPSLAKAEAMTLAAIACVIGSLPAFAWRSGAFAVSPTVPFDKIAQRYGEGFNRYAANLDIEDGSVLLPDLGGTLYCSKLKVYDLAGLCDKTIARTLRRNPKAFYDYVFETIKPTFIHTHGTWAEAARFDDDPRFRRDYTPIWEAPDEFIRSKYHLTMYSGDYVRKEAIRGREDALDEVRRQIARPRR